MCVLQIVQSSEMLSSILALVLRVLLHALGLNQSTTVLQNMFATQRSLVAKVCNLYTNYLDHL